MRELNWFIGLSGPTSSSLERSLARGLKDCSAERTEFSVGSDLRYDVSKRIGEWKGCVTFLSKKNKSYVDGNLPQSHQRRPGAKRRAEMVRSAEKSEPLIRSLVVPAE